MKSILILPENQQDLEKSGLIWLPGVWWANMAAIKNIAGEPKPITLYAIPNWASLQVICHLLDNKNQISVTIT